MSSKEEHIYNVQSFPDPIFFLAARRFLSPSARKSQKEMSLHKKTTGERKGRALPEVGAIHYQEFNNEGKRRK